MHILDKHEGSENEWGYEWKHPLFEELDIDERIKAFELLQLTVQYFEIIGNKREEFKIEKKFKDMFDVIFKVIIEKDQALPMEVCETTWERIEGIEKQVQELSCDIEEGMTNAIGKAIKGGIIDDMQASNLSKEKFSIGKSESVKYTQEIFKLIKDILEILKNIKININSSDAIVKTLYDFLEAVLIPETAAVFRERIKKVYSLSDGNLIQVKFGE